MPPGGGNDYDVVIGAHLRDETGEGSRRVRNNIERLTEDVRRKGEQQARQFARTSNDIFRQTDSSIARTADGMLKRLVFVFDNNNFLLRNLARQAGLTYAAIGIGIGKLGLSYKRFGTDTETASLHAKRSVESIKDAISGLGSDSNALPKAIRAAHDLSSAYEGMGKTAAASSIKAGSILEDAIYKKVLNLQSGLKKAESDFVKLKDKAVQSSEGVRTKINEVSASVSHLLETNVDADFFKAFVRAKTDLDKYKVVLDRLGPAATARFNDNQTAVTKLADSYVRLETRASKAMKGQADKMAEASNRVNQLKNELHAAERALSAPEKLRERFNQLKNEISAVVKEIERLKGLEGQIIKFGNVLSTGNFRSPRSTFAGVNRRPGQEAENLFSQFRGVESAEKKLASLQNEMKAVTGAAGEMGIGLEGATSSMGGLGAGAVAVGVALAAVVVAIIAVIAAVVAFSVVTVKGASAASEYGDEIYKLSLSTGLSTEKLSAFTIIARETGTQVDSLAKTFARTQVQIQRAIDKPFSEAGRAVRTLKVNMGELKKANPDQQVLMIAEAYNKLNNQNVRAAVSTQLFSVHAERQAKILLDIGQHFTIAQEKAKKFGLELDANGAVKAHMYKVATEDLKLAWDGLWIRLGEMILPQLTGLMESLADKTSGWGRTFEVVGVIIMGILFEIRVEMEKIALAFNIWQSFNFSPEGMFAGALTAGFGEAGIRKRLTEEDKARQEEYKKRVNELRKRQVQGDDTYAPGKPSKTRHEKTEVEKLMDAVKHLRFEVNALQDQTAKGLFVNKLKLEQEDLQRVKSSYEEILKLRYKMGLDFAAPLPRFNVRGTHAQQAQQMRDIDSYLQQLKRMESIFNDVRKVANENTDALAELAKVQQESLMPVTDAGTLAAIKYYQAVRDRAKAERELTAEVIAESRLRIDAIQDEVGATLKAYSTLTRDLGRQQDKTREQTQQDLLFLQLVGSSYETEDSLRRSLADRMGNTDFPVVPTELQSIAAHAATIDLNVAAIAEKIGANAANVTNSDVTTKSSSTGYMIKRTIIRNPDGTVEVRDNQINRGNDDDDYGPPVTVDSGREKGFADRVRDQAKANAFGERVTSNREAVQSILDNEARLNESLIDYDVDFRKHSLITQLERRNQSRETEIQLGQIESDLLDMENSNSKLYQQAWVNADKNRKESRLQLKNEIIILEDAIAHNGEDSAERQRVAQLRAIREIQEESNNATESIIRSQIRLSDQTTFHAERANAKVLEYLDSQRDITEAVADFKIGMVEGLFSSIEDGLSKITRHFGVMGDVVNMLITSLLRLWLSPVFQAMAGNQSQSGNNTIFNGTLSGGSGPTSTISNFVKSSFNGSIVTSQKDFERLFGDSSLPSPVDTSAGSRTSVGGTGTTQQSGIGDALKSLISPESLMTLGLTYGVTSWIGSLQGQNSDFQALTGSGLIGFFINRTLRRRREEKVRNTISNDTGTRIWQLIEQARSPRGLSVADAIAQWNEIDVDYHQRIAQIKDGKTRRNAEKQWNEDFLPLRAILLQNAKESEERESIRNRMQPEFANGGFSWENQLAKVRPGEGIRFPGSRTVHTIPGHDLGYDSQHMFLPKGTRVYTQREMENSEPYQEGGFVGHDSPSEGRLFVPESVELRFDADGLVEMILSHRKFGKAVVKNTKVAISRREL